MKDKKEISEKSKESSVVKKQSSQSEYTQNELSNELERLAQTFKEELEKAKELPDEEFEEVYADELGIIEDDDLCECCGERRKDKSRGSGYQYCSVCRDNMKRYPVSMLGVITAVAMIVIAAISVFSFSQDFYGYDLLYKAQKATDEHKLDTALKFYNDAIKEMTNAGFKPKNAYLESAAVVFEGMNNGVSSMYDVSTRITTGLTEFESKLPIYSSALELREECVILYGTMQHFYSILDKEEYADFDGKDEKMYNNIMTEIGSLIDQTVSVVSMDGETTETHPTNEAVVRFCQYMFAYMYEHYDDSYQYMLKTQELEPDYYWLYAYELGVAELQSGNSSEAKKLAKKILDINVEEADAYCLYTSAERVSGNYEKAARWADKGLEYSEDNTELMRYKAMALCANDKNDEAKKVIDKAIETEQYPLLYFTAIVIERELGNTRTVENYKELLSEEEVEFPDRMNDYLNEKITARELFTEGTGEVQ